MIPLLICTFRPRYLEHVLRWMRRSDVEQRFRIFAWDNGGGAEILRSFGLTWQHAQDDSGATLNLGKALAMHYLMDAANEALPAADCVVCMDDDIIVDLAQLDALVAAARRPGLGMVAGRFHPFNSAMPAGGTVRYFDPCPVCLGGAGRAACKRCNATGLDPQGLQLSTFPPEDRTVRNMGRVAGGLFAISKTAIARLPWAPQLYPVKANASGEPVVYWTEDASLDGAATQAGLINGYLSDPRLTPAIHLPELDSGYMAWKAKVQVDPDIPPYDGVLQRP